MSANGIEYHIIEHDRIDGTERTIGAPWSTREQAERDREQTHRQRVLRWQVRYELRVVEVGR